MIIEAVAVNILTFTQTVDTNIKILNVEHLLGISDAVRQNILPQQLHSSLYLMHSVEVEKSVALAASNTLTLSQSSQPRVFIENVSQFLFIWQEAKRETQFPLVEQELILTQQADVSVAKGVYDVLTLTQEVIVLITRNITVAQTLPLNSEATGFLPQLYAGCS